MTTEKSAVNSRKSARRAKSPGAAAAALYRGQEGSTAGKTGGRLPRLPLVHRCPPSPGVQHQGEGGQGQQADTRVSLSCPAMPPSYPIRVSSEARGSHLHANLPKPLPSSPWSQVSPEHSELTDAGEKALAGPEQGASCRVWFKSKGKFFFFNIFIEV